ncbi:hypothetical protein PAPHI01_1875 [Pancytospora philotis]|nr:hypothetical protein PAPHI01_1875 [Pancytospora philotis]
MPADLGEIKGAIESGDRLKVYAECLSFIDCAVAKCRLDCSQMSAAHIKKVIEWQEGVKEKCDAIHAMLLEQSQGDEFIALLEDASALLDAPPAEEDAPQATA